MSDQVIKEVSTRVLTTLQRQLIINVVKCINQGRASEAQIRADFAHQVSMRRATDDVDVPRAVSSILTRLRSRSYAFRSPGVVRWVWTSRPGWPKATEQEIIDHLCADIDIRLDDIIPV